RGETPGENSTTRNTVPPGSVVPVFFRAASPSPELSAGIESVVHTTHADAPGRLEITFFETSSIFTTARPLASCPVTTRRTLMAFSAPSFGNRCADYRGSSGPRVFETPPHGPYANWATEGARSASNSDAA